ncbi:phenylalanine--tRNA ligase subunit alpha [Candidatus Woesearchaeota archaeon]|nr:MAG: phenylalanine--tRNA ligase subunit alpha [Candidatus Woesearchaeota archaeon]
MRCAAPAAVSEWKVHGAGGARSFSTNIFKYSYVVVACMKKDAAKAPVDEARMIVSQLTPLERAVLSNLDARKSLTALVAKTGLSQVEVMRALQWLDNKKLITSEVEEQEFVTISEKGKEAFRAGGRVPEDFAKEALKERGVLPLADVAKVLPSFDKGAVGAVLGALKKEVTFDRFADPPSFRWSAAQPLSLYKGKAALEFAAKHDWCIPVASVPKEVVESVRYLVGLKGYAEKVVRKERFAKPTLLGVRVAKIAPAEELVERLSSSMLKNGSWKGKSFRAFDVRVNVKPRYEGRVHFVNEAIEYVRRIWLDMGFVEMEGGVVQTAFWNMDALFIPQDHPAREMQDTFYLKDPSKGHVPKRLASRVKAVHENGGGTGSTGWREPWRVEKARELLLRTHTTVLSARTLAGLSKKDLPAKFFSIGKVYRNEALDWKHLFEFHQVEGIVVDPEANLQHLKGYLSAFYRKMGFAKVRMRPAHFPYTEPSIETEVFDARRKEWIEMGGSGIFRPEVTYPLLGEEIPVLAWGLGLERIITAYFGIKDLREIYSNDVEQLRTMKRWLQR